MSNPLMMMTMMGGMSGGGMDPMMMMMLMNQMGSDSDDSNSMMNNPMMMMALLGGGGVIGGPGGGINPMMMLMLANMGGDGKTDPKLEEYLNKSWEKGKRKLSVGVNYGRVPLEYSFMDAFGGFPLPTTGSFMQPSSLQRSFAPGSISVPSFPGISPGIPSSPQLGRHP